MSYFTFLGWYWQMLICIPFIVLSILFHEQAHYKVLKHYNKDAQKPKFFNMKYIISWDKGSLSIEQERDIYWAGILFGLFPIVLILYFVHPIIFFASIIIYFYGCKHDIKELLLRNGN